MLAQINLAHSFVADDVLGPSAGQHFTFVDDIGTVGRMDSYYIYSGFSLKIHISYKLSCYVSFCILQ